ncbi:MAG TPA: hypothetical protein VMW55_11095 [Nitrosopumilaceae archaeon]|jgi:hypothetical protein|nr:hypothetical protein [Nitrosopumilaceae archaeon]
MTNYTDNQKIKPKTMKKISALTNSPKIGLLVSVIEMIVKAGSSM